MMTGNTKCKPGTWKFTCFTSFNWLLLCLVLVRETEAQCGVEGLPPCEPDSLVVCPLSKNFKETKHGLYIAHSVHDGLNIVSKQPAELSCGWHKGGSITCHSKNGFSLKGLERDRLYINVPPSKLRADGFYTCHLVPEDSEIPFTKCAAHHFDEELTAKPELPNQDKYHLWMAAFFLMLTLFILLMIIQFLMWKSGRTLGRTRNSQFLMWKSGRTLGRTRNRNVESQTCDSMKETSQQTDTLMRSISAGVFRLSWTSSEDDTFCDAESPKEASPVEFTKSEHPLISFEDDYGDKASAATRKTTRV